MTGFAGTALDILGAGNGNAALFLAWATLALLLGFLLDLLVGDPQGWPHLVRLFGRLIAGLERRLYPWENKRRAGAVLVLVVVLTAGLVPAALLTLAWSLSPWVYLGLETLLCWQCLAVKSLRVESLRVYTALAAGDLPGARKALSWIVGRDTDPLDEAGVTRAAVETVAENASDGVGAPLFWLMLGGSVLGCVYKAINTMDSMLGYRNDRYRDFGRCAARLDDAANFLPARLCAGGMLVASVLCGLDGRGAFRIWRRDRRKHASPNSAQTEAVMAGALGVRLAGPAQYFGCLHSKPYIGDDTRPIQPGDILLAHRLLYAAAVLSLLAVLLVRGCVCAAL